MPRLASDWFVFVILNFQLFFQIGDYTINLGFAEIPAKWIICPVLVTFGIIWKFKKDIHGRIFPKRRVIHEYV